MLSRGLVSAGSLLRGSRVFMSRALRPVSQSRLVSNHEATATDSGYPQLHRVTTLDRYTLIATRTMKPPIPVEVQGSTMDRANNRRRIGINGLMILATLVASLWIIKSSQKGRDENTLESLHQRNVKRYEKLREQDAAAATAAKADSGK